MTNNAINAIGNNNSEDWRLTPAEHAKELPAEAGALKRILEREELKRLFRDFNEADAAAISAQKKYRFWGRLGIYAIALAALIGTALILRVDEKFGLETKWLAIGFEYGFLLIAFCTAQYLAFASPFQKWMENRGKAEILRVTLFDKVARAEEETESGELPLLALQLEYFRRYQLDVQRAYYKGRGEEHANSAGRSSVWKWVSILLTILWAAIAGTAVLHFFASQEWMQLPQWLANMKLDSVERWIMALGVVISSLYSASAARSLMDLDERNAARYKTTSDNLEHITATLLQRSRDAADAGNKEAVLGFVQLVQNQISSEHREWIILRDVAPNATALLAQIGAPGIVGTGKSK